LTSICVSISKIDFHVCKFIKDRLPCLLVYQRLTFMFVRISTIDFSMCVSISKIDFHVCKFIKD